MDTSVVSPAKALIDASRQLAPNRGGMVKPMRVLICGIPNVGKSTLINTLKGKRAAKTGDEAGVTKLEQRITLADDFYLYDTPGVLWPRIIVEQSGYNLAASGAIGVNAFDEEVVALELLHYLIPATPRPSPSATRCKTWPATPTKPCSKPSPATAVRSKVAAGSTPPKPPKS
jgi:ribosome biogenesis GTPase A